MTVQVKVVNCDPARIYQNIRASLARQGFSNTFGVYLSAAGIGFVEVVIPYSQDVSDGNGRFHTGIIGTLADIVGSYAGFTVLPESDSALSFEYKLNVLEPAIGDKIIGRGTLVKEGTQTMFSTAEIYSCSGKTETLCATGSASIFILRDAPDAPDEPRGGCVPD